MHPRAKTFTRMENKDVCIVVGGGGGVRWCVVVVVGCVESAENCLRIKRIACLLLRLARQSVLQEGECRAPQVTSLSDVWKVSGKECFTRSTVARM